MSIIDAVGFSLYMWLKDTCNVYIYSSLPNAFSSDHPMASPVEAVLGIGLLGGGVPVPDALLGDGEHAAEAEPWPPPPRQPRPLGPPYPLG
jgi:hypothetical protein